jgi:uncharacterized protein YbjT (DUF2867 family)
MRIAVAGANGFVGQHLIPQLVAAGHDVVGIDTDPYEGEENIRSVEADIREYSEYADSLEGVETAYYLVHSMNRSDKFAELEQECAETFRRACDDVGIDRIIFIGGILHHDHISKHLTSRTTVGRILAKAKADMTEFRAAMILGWESSSFQIMYQLVSRLPAIIGPRWLQSRCQPIYIGDMVHYLVTALDKDEMRGEIYEVGGRTVHTYKHLLEILGDEIGKTPHIVTVPFLTPHLSSLWVELFTDYPASLVRALVESLREDMVQDDTAINDVIPYDCLSYREAVRTVLTQRGL